MVQNIKTRYAFVAGCVESRQGGRPENQDTPGYADTALGLLVVVCDGMGGGPGGKTASQTAVATIIRFMQGVPAGADRKEALRQAILAGHAAVYNLAVANPALRGMGTTVTALLINDYSAIIAHAGDSRVYQFRFGGKEFRTWDHSRVFELLRAGSSQIRNEEEARTADFSNIITSALGLPNEPQIDVVERPYERGDRFMLCTDGIWGAMPEKKLIKLVTGVKSLPGCVEQLAIKVDEIGQMTGGHHDNLTVAVVETSINGILKENMTSKTRNLMLGLAAVAGLSLMGNLAQSCLSSNPDTRLAEAQKEIAELREERNNLQKQVTELQKNLKTLEHNQASAKEKEQEEIGRKKLEDELKKNDNPKKKDTEVKPQEEKEPENKKAEEKKDDTHGGDSAELAELHKKLQEIMDMLEKMEKEQDETSLKDLQAQAKVAFAQIKDDLKSHAADAKVDKVADWIGQSMTLKKTDQGAGHRNSIKKEIKKIMNNLK